jgi:hypothetical protein
VGLGIPKRIGKEAKLDAHAEELSKASPKVKKDSTT